MVRARKVKKSVRRKQPDEQVKEQAWEGGYYPRGKSVFYDCGFIGSKLWTHYERSHSVFLDDIKS